MTVAVLVNGLPSSEVQAADRGFQYGDGVFTTVAVRSGAPELWLRHLDRLERDARALAIPPPDRDVLTADARQLLAGTGDAILKILWTRGMGGRGYRPPEHSTPTRVLMRHAWPEYPPPLDPSGAVVRLCRTRLGHNPALAGIKHLNRLEQILASTEWRREEADEGLLLDGQGWLVEGTLSNLFLVRRGVLLTPRLDRCGVSGLMRGLVLEVAHELGVPVEQRRLALAELWDADEAFLTNSVRQLWPIAAIEHRRFDRGPITERIQRQLWIKIRDESRGWSA